MSEAGETIRVVIADDHNVMRAGLRLLIDAEPDLEVVGEASSGRGALEQTLEHQPDVALLDLSMPGGGVPAVEAIRSQAPATRVLILSMHDDEAYLRGVLAAGASGYVIKASGNAELLTAIRNVHSGRSYINVTLGEAGLSDLFSRQATGPLGKGEPLTSREQQVLTLVAQGHTNTEVADKLGVSVKTVSNDRSRINENLGFSSRAELVRYALEAGLLRPPSEPS